MKGFKNYQIDFVIKFGGSILGDYSKLKPIIKEIEDISAEGIRFLIIPGGGPTDNTIEALDKQLHFYPETHHRACARAQDQTGLMISDKNVSTILEACENFEEVEKALLEKKFQFYYHLVVFLS